MELTHQDVVAILELVERADVEYLEVEVGGTRIVADRSGATTQARGVAPAAAAPAPAAPAPAAPPAPVAPAAVAPAPPAPPPAAPAPVADGLVVVPSPMVGVFFTAPQPGAPPFVQVGSVIEEGTTLGLVEVMKMFNSVTSPAAGEVVEVLAANEEFVEFGQPLFRLRPATAG